MKSSLSQQFSSAKSSCSHLVNTWITQSGPMEMIILRLYSTCLDLKNQLESHSAHVFYCQGFGKLALVATVCRLLQWWRWRQEIGTAGRPNTPVSANRPWASPSAFRRFPRGPGGRLRSPPSLLTLTFRRGCLWSQDQRPSSCLPVARLGLVSVSSPDAAARPEQRLKQEKMGYFYSAIFNYCAAKFLKHAIPDYLLRGTGLFSLKLSNKKNDNSQHNTSCLV